MTTPTPEERARAAIGRQQTASAHLVPIRNVCIENFRGIRHASIALDPHVTVFFGVNAAGKTTILDAIAIGLGTYVTQFPRAKGVTFAKRGDIRVPWLPRIRPSKGADAKSTPQEDDDGTEKIGVERPFARVTIEASSGVSWDATKLRWKGEPAKKPALGTKQLRQYLEPLILDGLERGSGFSGGSGDGAADGTSYGGPSSAQPIPLVAAYGTERAVVAVPLRKRDFKSEFDRFGALDESLRTNTRFKSVFEWFVVAEDEERRERERRKDFDYRHPTLEWVRRAVERAGLRCNNPRIETKPSLRMLVNFLHQDGSHEALDITALSDGYRTHFALVVDIARRMVQLNPSDDLSSLDRGTNSEAVILIDEVDLHLDPTWQATVVKGLREAFPRAQFVLTTHSEQVIGSVQACSVRKLVAGAGEVLVENVPFAEGATNERILIELMGAKERAGQAADGENTKRLSEYMALVSRGHGATPATKALRAVLDLALPGDERLHHADLEMQKADLLRMLRGDGG
ncbi:MAG: AAA family ATPase [Myxococcales bacterium]|nr:AAA family ATPase [Myxococcales bacterium]